MKYRLLGLLSNSNIKGLILLMALRLWYSNRV